MLQQISRRHFGRLVAGAYGTREAAAKGPAKPMRGVFPIALSPFTDANELDLNSLAAQFQFMARHKVPGFVWPQLASEWETLRKEERLAGMERLGGVARQAAGTALVLGVQSASGAQAMAFAREAERVGADAIIALPPPGDARLSAMVSYFRDIGRTTQLPLMLQATGQFRVEDVAAIARETPSLRFVKDEAGQPLHRFAALRAAGLAVFSGGHGKTMFDEMNRGFAGTMPATSFADIYAQAWRNWERGARKQALRQFGRVTILINEIIPYPDAMKYVLHLRGVFPNYRLRNTAATGLLDDAGKRILAELVRELV